MSDELTQYFRGQQVPLQWYGVLRAMAASWPAEVAPSDLRRMMFRVGEQFANDTQALFEGCQSLPQLEDALGDFWTRLNWGSVCLTEEAGAIGIDHRFAPLAEAFGDDALAWSVGLLEGFYQTVFRSLGADASMGVTPRETETKEMNVRLRFGSIPS